MDMWLYRTHLNTALTLKFKKLMKSNCIIWIIKAHGPQLLSLEEIVLAGAEEYKMEEDHQNIKIDQLCCYITPAH